MASTADALMLRVLADELLAHVAALRRLVGAFEADPSRIQTLRDARQRAHTIAASASLLGDDPLVRTGEVVERTFDLLTAHPADEQLRATLPWCLDDLDYLVGCLAGGEAYAAAAGARAAAAEERLDLAVSLSGVFSVPSETSEAPEEAPAPAGQSPTPQDILTPPPSAGDGDDDPPALAHLGSFGDGGAGAAPPAPESRDSVGAEPSSEEDLGLLPLDLDAQLLETVSAEGLELVASARDQLEILRVSPDDPRALRDLRGCFEAIAGAADLVGDRRVAARAAATLASVDGTAAHGPEGVLALLDLLPPEIGELEQALRDGLEPEAASPERSGVDEWAGPDDGRSGALASASPRGDTPPYSLPEELEALWDQVGDDATDEAALATLVRPNPDADHAAGVDPAHVVETAARDGEASGGDPEILAIFAEEARALLAEAGTALDDLRARPSRDAAETLRRCVHTLKGAAAMIGLGSLSDEARALEEPLDRALDDPDDDAAWIVPDLESGLRRLSEALRERVADPIDDGFAPAGPLAPLDEIASGGYGKDYESARAPSWQNAPEPADAPALQTSAPDDDVRAVFLEEAGDLAARLTDAFMAIEQAPADSQAVAEARRAAHTLKGAAAATGFLVVADLCHAMENLLDGLADGALAVTEQTTTLLFAAGDELDRLLARVQAAGTDATAGSTVPQLELQILNALDQPRSGPARSEADTPGATPASMPAVGRPGEETTEDGLPALTRPHAEDVRPDEPAAGTPRAASAIRVDVPRLDALINLVGELVINRSALDQRLARMRHVLQDLGTTAGRLRRIETTLSKTYEARELARADAALAEEFDSLEMDRYTELHLLSRELTEMVADVGTVERELRDILGELTTMSARQARYSADMQERLLSVRMVKLDAVLGRAYRAARDLAMREGKPVRVRVGGRDVEVDKTIVEGLGEALLHLVRNAVDHGVEAAEQRAAMGKPDVATLSCVAAREGHDVVIRVRDDGAGIDPERVFQRAVERGLVAASAALTTQEKLDLVFVQGLSTRDSVTDLSGRGVGLDVVKATIERLHGSVRVESARGVGTAFVIRLPMTLAIARALLVRAGDRTFAVPVASVTELARVSPRDVSRIGRQRAVRVRDDVVPLLDLADTLGTRVDAGRVDRDVRAMIVRTARGDVAIAADAFSTQQEIVVKPLPPHLRAARGILGATILGDGRVVLILDPPALAGEALAAGSAGDTRPHTASSLPRPGPRRPSETATRPVAMVVDDSLSIRRIVSNVLEAHGFQVVQAKDGAEALERLEAARPSVVFLDVEMPRMNGFELLDQIRRSPAHRELPVAMLTSRSGEHHRSKARQLGVRAYLTKPSPDAVIVDTARKLAGIAGVAGERPVAAR